MKVVLGVRYWMERRGDWSFFKEMIGVLCWFVDSEIES